jgi:alpha-aminoadipic semialdehyde synthase
MDGDGVLCMAVDILPTEFAKEVCMKVTVIVLKIKSKVKNLVLSGSSCVLKKASQHFGDILSGFVGSLASMTEISDLPAHLKRACISYRGELTSLYEYIPRMRKSNPEEAQDNIIANGVSSQRTFNILVSFDEESIYN